MKVELAGHYGYRRIVKTMIPSMLMILTTSVYSIVDGLFISNTVGSVAFAAINMIWPALMLVGSLGIMMGTGGSALVSKTLGQGDKEKACRIFSMIVYFTLLVGALMALTFYLLLGPIVELLGADEAMRPQCIIYASIFLIGMPAFMSQLLFEPFYMTAEKPAMGTWMTVICGIINIALDALFIVVLHWGLMGAALATIISMFVAGGYPLWYFSSKKNTTHLRIVSCRFVWRYIAKAASNGMSEYVGNISLSLISICYNIQLMHYIGEQGVAAYGIMMYVSYIYAALFIGYNIGITPIIGYNYGAQNHSELKSLLRKSIIIISTGGLLLTLIAIGLSDVSTRIFVGYDPELTELTAHGFRLYMLCFLICGVNMFVSAWFTALNNGVVSAIAAFSRTLIFELGAVFLLPLWLGLDGIWLAVNVADVIALGMSIVLLKMFQKKYGY